MAFASCAKVEFGNPRATRDEISFSTTLNQETKGDATLVDLTSDGNGWGVYAYYTEKDNYTSPNAASGVIFNNRQVRWDDGNNVWDYSLDANHKKEYWPMDPEENVTFFAYGPWADYHGAASVDPDEGPQVTYTASTDLSNQKDLLWGTSTSGLPHRNVHMDDYADSKVDMHFRHAPAKLHFTINGATLADETGQPTTQGPARPGATQYDPDNQVVYTNETTGGTYTTGGRNYTLYYAYRKKYEPSEQNYRQTISGYKILVSNVVMRNFFAQGTLHLNNPDAFTPYWTTSGNNFIDYTFGTSAITPSIIYPGTYPSNESTISSGWGTTYLGVDSDPKELLPTPNNYIYMVPKTADNLIENSNNISISVDYHVVGLSKAIQFTRTTTRVSYQRRPYYTRNNANTFRDNWTDVNNNANYPSYTTVEDGASTDVNNSTAFNYSQDNVKNDIPLGFRATGSIKTDIIGGRNYTINLYLDGRELNLTVIPQPWDLQETVFDYNSFVNPVIQSLTYDSDFVYQVINDNVYINNRMGKFYFKLGSGMYLYWQASLIGDDAFAFTDENGEYLRNEDGSFKTAIRGNIGDDMNYIYVKAINTAAQVTSKAKLRIYLFNSENRAVVALPKDNWLFVSSTYIDQGEMKRVQEWSVVQSAN